MSKHESIIKKLEASRTSNAASEMRIPRDPVAFARLLGIEPDPWQRDLLTATDPRIILNCGRQTGKSTVVAILALHHALTRSAVVPILAKSQRQSEELLRKVVAFFHRLGAPGGSRGESATALELNNGSRVIALPGSEETTRGYSASLLLIDEAARVSDELYYSSTPMLAASNGQLILLSTPHGKQGVFYRTWNEGQGWKKITVPAEECSRITKEFLDEERRTMGESWFRQEYCCEFTQEEGAIFNEAWVQFYVPGQLPPMDVTIQSWDTALTASATSDYVVGQVWGRSGADYYLLGQMRHKMGFDLTVEAIKLMKELWPQSTAILIEAQTLGDAIASHLQDEIEGITPVHMRENKELRAWNCVPLWRLKRVWLPTPDGDQYKWMHDYLQELLNFPDAGYDDQVDATTLALNHLRAKLFPSAQEHVARVHTQPIAGRFYNLAWVPAYLDQQGAVLALDMESYEVVFAETFPPSVVPHQLTTVAAISRTYNDAVVFAVGGSDEGMLQALEYRGTWVQRVTFTAGMWQAAYENLSLLLFNGKVSYPAYSQLMAELDAFSRSNTRSGKPDYPRHPTIQALCLLTYDLSPRPDFLDNVYSNHDLEDLGLF
ncbi:MAG: phage terminase large subunit [Halobacteriota archaeon]